MTVDRIVRKYYLVLGPLGEILMIISYLKVIVMGGAPKGSSASEVQGFYNYNTTCDRWHSEDCNLIRTHVQPRLQLFTPFGTRDPRLPGDFTQSE